MSVKYQDYYQILGVDRNATEKEIKAAYRRLARKYHPDMHTGEDKAKAEETFKKINEAYEVLSDPEKRAKYDRLGQNWQAGQDFGFSDLDGFEFYTSTGTTGFSDFFEILFGSGGLGGFRASTGASSFGRRRSRGSDVEAEVELTLEEAFRGTEKLIQLNVNDTCDRCAGTGISGRSICRSCAGTGQKSTLKTVAVKIPPGITEGQKIRLKGQGSGKPGARGDLYLKVRYLPHPTFRVNGNDLESDLVIAPWQAVLGGMVKTPTLDGPVTVSVPPGSRAGRKLRLRGKGMPKNGVRGDHYLCIVIDIPAQLTPEEIELYKKLSEVAQGKEGRK